MNFKKKRREFANFSAKTKEKRVKGFEKFEKFKKAKNPSPNERIKQNKRTTRERERERVTLAPCHYAL